MKPLYNKNFIFKPNVVFDDLMNLDWVQRDKTPRKEYWDTTLGQSYTYGSGRGVRTYVPNAPSSTVSKIRRQITDETGIFYEGCFLNRYDTAKDSLGWHADDDPSIDHSKPIVVITLGQGREIQWKEIGSKGLDSINTQFLDNGSMFTMPAGMPQTHLHRIPRAGYEIERSRISLTFRALL